VTGVDGSVLRELRQQAGVGLRRIAGAAKVPVSDGHLSRVERGLRPVTPAIVSAYETALGVRVHDAVPGAEGGTRILDQARRQAYTSMVATVAVGGPAGEPVERLLAAAGGATTAVPARVGVSDTVHLEQGAALVRRLDLGFGGGLVWQMGSGLLRWAVRLRRSAMASAVRVRLDRAIGALAAGTGWAAFDAGRHDAARALFTVALEAAVQAGDVDLRGHVLADVGAQYNYLGCPDDCLTIVRLADGDERIGAAVRHLLHGVKAHAYAARRDADGCARHIDLAEAAAAAVEPAAVPAWMGEFHPAHAVAVTGHAAAVLACASGDDGDLVDAHKRLMRAADGLPATGRSRALALCRIRSATLHLAADQPAQAACLARQALESVVGLRSSRVERALAALRTRAVARPGEPAMRDLAEWITVAAA
jgi:transcriptional regulator with XRE-family HTH domain